MGERSKSKPLSLRITDELHQRVERARLAHPYKPSLTAVIERGLELAIAELEAARSERAA